jgi:predicted protein tyrosine phosphatase
MPPSRFRINWVLVNELAIGPAPRVDRHLSRLADQGVRSVLSLCAHSEAPPPPALERRFRCARLVLPDHRAQRLPEPEELAEALALLEQLRAEGPVFVHCVAAMERSPLLCLAWLVSRHGQSPQAALDYLMQVHPGTNPLPGQLRLLALFERREDRDFKQPQALEVRQSLVAGSFGAKVA